MERVLADRPDVIINCAAYNNVDRAEDEAEHGAEGQRVRRSGARARGAGDRRDAACTTARTSCSTAAAPVRTRGRRRRTRRACTRSRSCSENGLPLEAPRAFVLRVESLFGGDERQELDRSHRRGDREGREAQVFRDRIVSPSYVVDVAAATRALVERGEPGLYHCVGTGHATWYEVGLEIARVMGKERRGAPAARVGRRRAASRAASAVRGAGQ